MKYHDLFVVFEKQQNFKLFSAANYRWGFLPIGGDFCLLITFANSLDPV